MSEERFRRYEVEDPTFVADLERSGVAVWRAARWLSARGKHVTVRAVRVRPRVEEIGEYGDEGDLEVIGRVEVKHRSLVFDSLRSFPHPTVLVDVVSSWERARPKPSYYLIFNRDLTGLIKVPGGDRPGWLLTERRDGRIGRVRKYYECPIERCEYFAVEEPKGEAAG